jgi:hypothetical protein
MSGGSGTSLNDAALQACKASADKIQDTMDRNQVRLNNLIEQRRRDRDAKATEIASMVADGFGQGVDWPVPYISSATWDAVRGCMQGADIGEVGLNAPYPGNSVRAHAHWKGGLECSSHWFSDEAKDVARQACATTMNSTVTRRLKDVAATDIDVSESSWRPSYCRWEIGGGQQTYDLRCSKSQARINAEAARLQKAQAELAEIDRRDLQSMLEPYPVMSCEICQMDNSLTAAAGTKVEQVQQLNQCIFDKETELRNQQGAAAGSQTQPTDDIASRLARVQAQFQGAPPTTKMGLAAAALALACCCCCCMLAALVLWALL